MIITKKMATPSSRWAKVRDDFEKLYDKHTKDYFLDVITTAYVVKEADLELAVKGATDWEVLSELPAES